MFGRSVQFGRSALTKPNVQLRGSARQPAFCEACQKLRARLQNIVVKILMRIVKRGGVFAYAEPDIGAGYILQHDGEIS